MITYKRKDAKNGRVMYFKNGKMTSPSEIPQSILNQLTPDTEISVDSPAPKQMGVKDKEEPAKPASKEPCVFECGKPATRRRFLNMQIIRLCDEDYEGHTTGEIVAQSRKVATVQE